MPFINTITREDIVLAALAAVDGSVFTPVQVQKMMFLIDQNIAVHIGGKKFNFRPDNYGPFDGAVYDTIAILGGRGLAEIGDGGRWKTYRATSAGAIHGKVTLTSLGPDVSDYLRRLSEWVRSLSFSQLVSAIYEQYPQMREKSIFRSH